MTKALGREVFLKLFPKLYCIQLENKETLTGFQRSTGTRYSTDGV